MPVALRAVEDVVVSVLGIEDSLLHAHITRNAVSASEERLCGQNASHTAIPVCNWVNRQEVENERPNENDGVRELSVHRVVEPRDKLGKEELGLSPWRGLEEDDAATVLVATHDLVV